MDETDAIEITESRDALVGKLHVRRALPRRGRRTVGAWCFADHFGPTRIVEGRGTDIGPHPHMGIQTVTWLLEGAALHRDSLGSEQLITPGQLNLMTAGSGVAHAEQVPGHHRGGLHGIQLWIAQPEATRSSAAAFEHHAQLPRVEVQGAVVTILIGEVLGEMSLARHDRPLVGAERVLHGEATVPLERSFEHAVIVLDGSMAIDGRPLLAGRLGFLAAGREELVLDTDGATALLIGGEPFPEQILMWWNFVARTREEIGAAYVSWRDDDGRFGRVASMLQRIETKPPHWQPVP